MSYHGTAVFISRWAVSAACAVDHLVPDDTTHPYQTYFFDDIVRNSQQQDTMAAVTGSRHQACPDHVPRGGDHLLPE
jgi:hypothetical protein